MLPQTQNSKTQWPLELLLAGISERKWNRCPSSDPWSAPILPALNDSFQHIPARAFLSTLSAHLLPPSLSLSHVHFTHVVKALKTLVPVLFAQWALTPPFSCRPYSSSVFTLDHSLAAWQTPFHFTLFALPQCTGGKFCLFLFSENIFVLPHSQTVFSLGIKC